MDYTVTNDLILIKSLVLGIFMIPEGVVLSIEAGSEDD